MRTVLPKRLNALLGVLLLAGPAGCGGAVNVQTSGGGADGFATLGAILLGTATLRYIHDQDRRPARDDAPPPPDARPDGGDESGPADSGGADPVGW